MDLRLGPPSRPRILPRARPIPGAEEGIRLVLQQAPKAEAVAAGCVERTRPVWSWLAREWRRLGTLAAVALIAFLVLHAIFGANGMMVYRQKRGEMESLGTEVDRLQKDNERYAETIRALKSDPKAIEKEAREQLHYTRPGEYVYVAPEARPKPPTGQAKNGSQ